MAILTAEDIMRGYGQRVNDRKCSCCDEFNLVKVTYDEHCTILLCIVCDVEKKLKP